MTDKPAKPSAPKQPAQKQAAPEPLTGPVALGLVLRFCDHAADAGAMASLPVEVRADVRDSIEFLKDSLKQTATSANPETKASATKSKSRRKTAAPADSRKGTRQKGRKPGKQKGKK